MPTLSVRDLATITAGRIHLADLPPLLGVREPVTSIHFSLTRLSPGSLFWNLQACGSTATMQAEFSFMQGATGLLLDDGHVEPWAGRYTLRVSNARLALRHLAAYLRSHRQSRVIAVTPRHLDDPICQHLQSILGPAAQCTFGNPAEVPLPCSQSDTVLELREPIADHGSASLLLSGPEFLITGHADPFLLAHHDRHVIHQILESLLPNGTLILAELQKQDTLPCTDAPSSLPAPWEQALRHTDITLFRIGPSHLADLRISATAGNRGETHLEVDGFFLTYTPERSARLSHG